MPKISVVIPLFNQGGFLIDSIRSLEAQTFQDWEAIIVNDGSTDDSLEVAQVHTAGNQRFKVVNRPNGGLSAARNTGLQHVTGKYVALLDSDDYFLPGHLAHLNAVLDAAPHSVMVAGRIQETNAQLHPIGKLRVRHNDLLEDRLSEELLRVRPLGRLVWNNPFVPCSQLWRADYLCQNPYDEALRSNEDWDVLWRAVNFGHRVSCSPEVVSYYRRHGSSLNWNMDQMVRTRLATYWKNIAGLAHDSVERRAADLSATFSLLPFPEESPYRQGLNQDSQYHLDSLRLILKNKQIAPFATLWCCGALRRNRPCKDHLHYSLWQRSIQLLMRTPKSYQYGIRSLFERVRSKAQKK